MTKTKVAFLEGRLLSSQSEQSEKFSKGWLAGKKPIRAFWKCNFCFDHVNRLILFIFSQTFRVVDPKNEMLTPCTNYTIIIVVLEPSDTSAEGSSCSINATTGIITLI